MVVVQGLEAGQIRATIEVFRDLLVGHREVINGLNVYPVPDGDTGTNMSLTLQAVCSEFATIDDSDTENLAAVCAAISHGSLMGARGNSGVIMSQILRGLADALQAPAEGGRSESQRWAHALTVAAEAAYGAVQRPVEGTILTVIREAAEGATASASEGASLVETLEAAHTQGHDALRRTPDMLAVLKDAGVVDAGGTGMLLLLDALLHVVDARALPEPPEDFIQVSAAPAAASPGAKDGVKDGAKDGVKDIADLRYEVMFFLDCVDDRIDEFRSAWADIGDSIVVVGGDGIWNCHIHTDEIGASIEAGIDVGRPHKIRITDLLEELEHLETLVDPEATGLEEAPAVVVHSNEKTTCGVVTVGVGEGVRAIFKSLGSTAMVLGGQTMNPSTELLLHAVNSVAADDVLLMPNNKNIIAVAHQVDAHTDKTVRVVPTRSITEGFASLLEFDPQSSADANVEAMTAAVDNVVAGEVTVAVRSANSDAGPVEVGDFIGIGPDGIASVAADVVAATIELLAALIDTDEHEIVTLICGADASEAETSLIQAWLDDAHPEVDVEVHAGQQPLYPYYIGIE